MIKKILLIFTFLLLISCSSEELSYDECDLNQDGTTSNLEKKHCLPDNQLETIPGNLEEKSEENQDDYLIEEEAEQKESLNQPIFLTTMTHMEGGHNDDQSEFEFERHINQLTFAMDLADEYGAKITVESEKPFSKANTIWDNNFMQEIFNRGHGVGTHCDIGFKSEGLSYGDYVDQLKENKELVDDLIGAENNWGCSGAGSALDWVSGLQEAGFIYVNGVVGMHLLAIPLDERPEGYSDSAIMSGGRYHDHIPTEILDRTYLRMLSDANDFEDDGNGLIVSAGSMGKLSAISEGGYDSGAYIKEAELSSADIDKFVELLYDIDDQRDRSKISKVDLYFAVNQWKENEEDHLRYFFEKMQELEKEGIIKWATQKEVVETYLDVI